MPEETMFNPEDKPLVPPKTEQPLVPPATEKPLVAAPKVERKPFADAPPTPVEAAFAAHKKAEAEKGADPLRGHTPKPVPKPPEPEAPEPPKLDHEAEMRQSGEWCKQPQDCGDHDHDGPVCEDAKMIKDGINGKQYKCSKCGAAFTIRHI